MYRFEPHLLHDIVKASIHLPLEKAFDEITFDLDEAYPGLINTGERKWMFNNAGGAMGQMTLLHCSLSEYILIFGTPIGTEGHSGRYATDVYDYTIAGEMWTYLEGDTERTVYEPGSMAYLGKAQAKGYRVKDHAWMLEYGRGPVFSMLPFGLADTVFSTLDLRSFLRTMGGYTTGVVKSLVAGKI